MSVFLCVDLAVLSHVFGRLGKLVAVRPWTTIAISIFLVGALAYCGFSRFATETNPYKLYIPESARATRDDESRVLARFGWIPIQVSITGVDQGSSQLDTPQCKSTGLT